MSIDAIEAQRVFDASELLYGRQQVEDAIERLAAEISAEHAGSDPLLMCVMNGGLVPAGLLLPLLQFPLKVDYLHATRYRERTFGDQLQWKKHQEVELAGRDVILVDDILDEGHTLAAISDYCRQQQAARVSTVVLVEKRHDRGIDLNADFVGLAVPDRYVFGYGMDYKGYWRNAPGIYAAPETTEEGA